MAAGIAHETVNRPTVRGPIDPGNEAIDEAGKIIHVEELKFVDEGLFCESEGDVSRIYREKMSIVYVGGGVLCTKIFELIAEFEIEFVFEFTHLCFVHLFPERPSNGKGLFESVVNGFGFDSVVMSFHEN